jgi:hypothetical protein
VDIEGQSIRHLEDCVDNEFAYLFTDQQYIIEDVLWLDTEVRTDGMEIRPVVFVAPINENQPNNIVALLPPLNINKI